MTGQKVNYYGSGVEYQYDSLGHRITSRVLYQYNNYWYQRKFYVFDGDLLIGEVDASTGVVNAAYTWGAAGLVSERIPTGSYWYAFGPQGETRQLTDGAGNVVDQYTYTSYGVPVTATNNVTNPFRYGGQVGYYTDPYGTGIILCGARWYSPMLGRWLSRDRSGYDGGPNLYEYCDGDPVGLIDPEGFRGNRLWEWYINGMGGFSDWVDNTFMFGTTRGFGETAGLYDSGRASLSDVIWAGSKWGGMLAANGVGLGRAACSTGTAAGTALNDAVATAKLYRGTRAVRTALKAEKAIV